MLLIVCLYLAAPVGKLSARMPSACHRAEETLRDATLGRVLRLAAPHFGLTDAQLSAQHDAGQVQIDALGPVRSGQGDGVTYDTHDIIIDDVAM